MLSRRSFSALTAGVGLAAATRRVRAASSSIKIGVITDMTGPLSSVLGMGSVEGARMAVEDFGGSAASMPVEVIFADPNRNSFHWGYDTYMESAALAAELTREGNDTWYFLTIDYAFGHALEADARAAIEKQGGKVLGAISHPANTQDFSAFLLQAQASGAKVIGVANSGDDMERALKQGAEFGIWQKQKAAVFGLQLYNVPAIGLPTMQGVLHNSVFYWDRTDETRAFSKRFAPRNGGKPPAETHAVNYSGATQYLKAVRAAGTKDPDAVVKALHELPVEDFVSVKGYVRKDGRLIRPTFLLQVKKPEEVKATWDCLEVKSIIPGEQAFRPLSESACPLVRT